LKSIKNQAEIERRRLQDLRNKEKRLEEQREKELEAKLKAEQRMREMKEEEEERERQLKEEKRRDAEEKRQKQIELITQRVAKGRRIQQLQVQLRELDKLYNQLVETLQSDFHKTLDFFKKEVSSFPTEDKNRQKELFNAFYERKNEFKDKLILDAERFNSIKLQSNSYIEEIKYLDSTVETPSKYTFEPPVTPRQLIMDYKEAKKSFTAKMTDEHILYFIFLKCLLLNIGESKALEWKNLLKDHLRLY
jgi:hypothetical protein